jgi:hypothetical protein
MYRWGVYPTNSWIFNMVWNEYKKLSVYGYPSKPITNIMQFEKDMYHVCATERKCAGYGLSALASAYYDFNMHCQKNPNPARPALQNQLNGIRGSGYGGADSQIQRLDTNKGQTYSLLGAAKTRMDNLYLNKMVRSEYDFCPCESFMNFNNFVKNEVWPSIYAQRNVRPEPAWFGTSQSVNAAMSAWLSEYPAFGRGMDTKINNLKLWCKTACGR